MPKCKGCGKEIRWIKTAKGKNMPLDPEPKKMVVIRKRELTGSALYRNKYRTEDKEYAVVIDAYMPHWATCVKAEDFKK